MSVIRARETECEDTILAAAKTAGWRVHAERSAQTGDRHMTPIKGHPGWVDLVLVRGTEALFVELKRHPNAVEPEQLAWHTSLRAAGLTAGVVWVPEGMDRFVAWLTARPGDRPAWIETPREPVARRRAGLPKHARIEAEVDRRNAGRQASYRKWHA